MPAFLRTPSALNEIEYLGPEPDRWRSSATPELSAARGPSIFWTWNSRDLAAPDGLPAQRYDFLHDLDTAARLHPELADPASAQSVGLLPWQVEEDFERLTVDMREYRMLLSVHQDPNGAEQAVLYDAGCMGHYVADGSQPLHTTVNYNGWVERKIRKASPVGQASTANLKRNSSTTISMPRTSSH